MSIESAIPAHLLAERTRTRRIPDDYAPPYPAFVARSDTGVRQVVMAYLGLQYRGDQPHGALDVLDTALAATDGPGHHDRARHERPDGIAEIVTVAYWDDPAEFDRWFTAHRDSWLGDAVRDGNGRWLYHEVSVATADEQYYEYVDCAPGTGLLVAGD